MVQLFRQDDTAVPKHVAVITDCTVMYRMSHVHLVGFIERKFSESTEQWFLNG
jgi:hypothetical protein